MNTEFDVAIIGGGAVGIGAFNDQVADTVAVVERLRPFDVVCVMRERTWLTREILQQLPHQPTRSHRR